jgi:farnesyl-diphosphate farnesyltransferase
MTSTTTPNQNKKQGAYGLIPTHKHSIWSQLSHPNEILAVIRMGLSKIFTPSPKTPGGAPQASKLVGELSPLWTHLNKTSRSFAVVIKVLPAEAADAVCVFYLLLRALDTIEDEMDLTKFTSFQQQIQVITTTTTNDNATTTTTGTRMETLLETKARLVREFYKILPIAHSTSPSSTTTTTTTSNSSSSSSSPYPLSAVLSSRIGKDSEHELLLAIPLLIKAFKDCVANSSCQDAIYHVVREMGEGMAEYASRDMSQGTYDKADYDRYCHFVAGTVGYGLTRLFDATSLEENASDLVKDQSLWDGMGIFLQRTNIIRDICEDAVEGRAFWPVTVWKHGIDEISQVRDLRILNEMISHALELIPLVAKYLDRLHHPGVLRFCALPQVMALHTLAECYNNDLVFTGVVKIRTGCAAQIVLSLDNTDTELIREGYVHEMSKALINMRTRARTIHDAKCVNACNLALESLGVPPERSTLASIIELCLGLLFLGATLLLWWHFSLTGRSAALADMFARGDEALGQAFAMALASFTVAAMVFSVFMAFGGK